MNMFCNKCGGQLPDGAQACPFCGNQIASQPIQPPMQPIQPPVQADEPFIDQTVAVAPPAATIDQTVAVAPPTDIPPQDGDVSGSQTPDGFAQAEFEPAVKKKSKKGWIIGIASAVAVIAVAVCLILFTPLFDNTSIGYQLKGDYIEKFGTADEYNQYTQSHDVQGYVDSASSSYGSLVSAVSDLKNAEFAGQMQIDLVASEDAIALLESLLAERYGEMDLDWLDTVSLLMDFNNKDMNLQIEQYAEQITVK